MDDSLLFFYENLKKLLPQYSINIVNPENTNGLYTYISIEIDDYMGIKNFYIGRVILREFTLYIENDVEVKGTRNMLSSSIDITDPKNDVAAMLVERIEELATRMKRLAMRA